jgi:hypothetical protein
MRDFKITITDSERAAEWQAIMGTNFAYVKSLIPMVSDLPGHSNAMIYLLDIDQLTVEQRQRLVSHLCEKFGLLEEDVEAEIIKVGIPILAENCIVSMEKPVRWWLL